VISCCTCACRSPATPGQLVPAVQDLLVQVQLTDSSSGCCISTGVLLLPVNAPYCLQTVPSVSFTDAERKALTSRIQDAGTEVVEAKAGAGSATLSMAYAAARMAESTLLGLQGEPNMFECAFVESEVSRRRSASETALLAQGALMDSRLPKRAVIGGQTSCPVRPDTSLAFSTPDWHLPAWQAWQLAANCLSERRLLHLNVCRLKQRGNRARQFWRQCKDTVICMLIGGRGTLVNAVLLSSRGDLCLAGRTWLPILR